MEDRAASQLQTAPFLLRALALLIDDALLVLALLVFGAILKGVGLTDAGAFISLIVAGATYHVGFLIGYSATPGKMAMGLYVGDRDGRRVRPDSAILRYLVYFAGNAAFGIGNFVSLVLVLTDRRRRALHDRIAGTRVLLGRAPDDRHWENPPSRP